MQCKRCPSYEVTIDPEGITWRRCRWDGHQVYDNMECDAHSIKIKAFCEVKEEMRKETHHMDSGYKYKAFINGEWHDLTLSDSPNELTEWLQSNEEWTRVRHGHWIEHDFGLICSECNHYTETMYDEPFNNEFGKGWALKRPYYCGYCGARMDEVAE